MRDLFIGAGAAAAVFFMAMTGARGASLGLETATTTVTIGETITLDLEVSGLGVSGAPSLSKVDVDLSFDETFLSFNSHALGLFAGDVSLSGANDSSDVTGASSGSIRLREISALSEAQLDTLQPSAFVLASLEFEVLATATGSTNLSLSFPLFGGLFDATEAGGELIDTALSGLTLELTAPGNVIPELSFWILFCVAGMLVGRSLRARLSPA